MNYRLVSTILKSVWAIEPRAAIAHGAMLSVLLNETEIELSEESQPETFAVKPGGKRFSQFEDAPLGSAAVIPVIGELMKYDQWCGPDGMISIGETIKRADASPNIDAIILKIDSPGGTVDGTENLANIVKNTKKPTIAFVDGMMCSAALWVGSAADEIIASTGNDEIGSIGVMVSFADIQPYWEKMGIKFHRINADQSKDKNKVFYDALKGKYDLIKKEMLNPLADAFIDAVKENCSKTTSEQHTGKVFFAKNVIGSLVDSIGDLDFAVSRALSLHKPISKTIKI